MNIILTHGFRVKDNGAATIGTLKDDCLSRGFNVQMGNNGYNHLGRVRFCNDNYAELIAGMANPASVAIGHSNGCTLNWLAAVKGAPIRHMIMINPALDSDFEVPMQVDQVDVFHNPHDKPVWFSKFLWKHHWGDAGRVGYTGNDPRVTNFNTNDLWPSVDEHSDVFIDAEIQFGNRIMSRIMEVANG